MSVLGPENRLMMTFLAKDVDSLPLAMEEIRVLLRENHRLKDAAEDDFRMFDAGSIVSSAQSIAIILTVLLTSVATIVLIVSGIGIMKAVGAQKSSILFQFLLEAVLLSVIGGGIGIGVGESIIPFLNRSENFTVISSPIAILIAFSFSVSVGIFFGFYPALKASRLDPVDALRSE